ncbi:Uncharacterised protein [Salmonella enterica subsp. arizonae]|uniref:Uncharacterized protein n=1 Tax=Salmonella enterica subsp. arizonae TaxID=59203 RepID=A0A379TI55_SALER|nr:Uncharacterised protein [Salmonella enterica subsp. arizonae]
MKNPAIARGFFARWAYETVGRISVSVIRHKIYNRSKTVQVHHFHPCRDEVLHKLLVRIATRVNFRQRAQYGVGTKHQIGAGRRVFYLASQTIPAFEQLISVVGGLPLVTHIQQISEEVSAEHAQSVGKDTVLAAVKVGSQHTHPANQYRHFPARSTLTAALYQSTAIRSSTHPDAHDSLRNPSAIGFKQREHLDVGLILTRIHPARRKRYADADTRSSGRLLDTDHARQHNNIGQRGFIRRFSGALLIPAEREPQRR